MPPRNKRKIEREKKLRRIEEMMLKGVTNQHEIASAFNVSQPTVSQWMKMIMDRWGLQETGTKEQRLLRIRQLEHIIHLAHTEFMRSKKDKEEFRISERECRACRGSGLDEIMPDQWEDCRECDGRGKLKTQTIIVKDNTGDVQYLRVAKECIIEAAKLSGLSNTMIMGANILKESQGVGGEIERRLETMFIEAPADALVKCIAAVDELRSKMEEEVEQEVKMVPNLVEESGQDSYNSGEETPDA